MQNEEKDLRDRTRHFALPVVEMLSVIPKTTEAQVLGKRMLRSGTSVGANYREAYRGRSKAEFIAKCGDSLRELEGPPTGLSCSLMERLLRQKSSLFFDKNATNRSLYLL